ncbi:MAG TPA: alpha-glucan family phosphorylase [Terriglobales bacterium]|jgi:glycogen phosphorylase|nr:alpha-glucan family phosphorylase [Terriglobales bacterium]
MKSKLTLPTVAYFSMEIALDPAIPTYSGGLGVLAGDTLRSAADIGAPLIAVTLVYREGYFRQRLDSAGNQSEEPQRWDPEHVLAPVEGRVTIEIERRPVVVRAWKYTVQGVTGETVPVYLLDTNVPENAPEDRALTNSLYGGNERYRLCQEAVLGLGGIKLLNKLGYTNIQGYHMNEGHSSLLALGLLERRLDQSFAGRVKALDIESVRRLCIFTTHTPVPAGHDEFPRSLVEEVLGDERVKLLDEAGVLHADKLNMTYLALNLSAYVNGVAMRHGEVSRDMFPTYVISAITNGVHATTWTATAIKELFDQHIPAWRTDNNYLRYAISIPLEEIRSAHAKAKQELFAAIYNYNGTQFDPSVFTIGFARRASTYKRGALLFHDPERLRRIASTAGPIQIVYAGKAHPRDNGGKDIIREVFGGARSLADVIRTVYVENYDMNWGRLITSGVDVWLNNPLRPQEASGTSGMKAALNGVPSFSVVDGWWIEGLIEGVTGWAIGNTEINQDPASEIEDLYSKLENEIVPMFYKQPDRYTDIMRMAIALNGSFFNTQRMVQQYVTNAYLMRNDAVPSVPRIPIKTTVVEPSPTR